MVASRPVRKQDKSTGKEVRGVSMEELNISIEQLGQMNEIEKSLFNRFDFPCVHFGRRQITFNVRCFPVIGNMEAIKWYATGDYIIGLPAEKGEKNSFAVRQNTRNHKNYITTYPASLQVEKCIKTGYYKCYRYKDGIAIKRFEIIRETD